MAAESHQADESSLAYEQALRRARRRVRELRGFYRHLAVFAIVMPLLVVIDLLTSPHRTWFQWPLLGWGSGVLVHGLAVHSEGRWLGKDWEERKIAEMMAGERMRVLSTGKQLAEARLRLLQAQIEPHFLFNTLANVLSLIDTAPARASLMLEHFIGYLRSSLVASRNANGTVAQELRLLSDYLELLTIRMGERLHHVIDVEPGVETLPMAPMLLQPVVENAIRHGLEPRVDGGRIMIRLWREAGNDGPRLRIRIADDGAGFEPTASSGVGLGNLRERLEVLYDGRARLAIRSADPGTIVDFDLPIDEPAARPRPRGERE